MDSVIRNQKGDEVMAAIVFFVVMLLEFVVFFAGLLVGLRRKRNSECRKCDALNRLIETESTLFDREEELALVVDELERLQSKVDKAK